MTEVNDDRESDDLRRTRRGESELECHLGLRLDQRLSCNARCQIGQPSPTRSTHLG